MSNIDMQHEIVILTNETENEAVGIYSAKKEHIPYLKYLLREWKEKRYYQDKEGNIRIAEGLQLQKFYERAILYKYYSLQEMYTYYSERYIPGLRISCYNVRLDQLLGMLLFEHKNQFIEVDDTNDKFYEKNKEIIDLLISKVIKDFHVDDDMMRDALEDSKISYSPKNMILDVFDEAISAINWATTYCKKMDSKEAYLKYFFNREDEFIISDAKAMKLIKKDSQN